ncbi:MAG: RHS repeat-associated core domain-containing protein [Planctomycetes bacterium]|nr:RHS repeat-associated core domain-containing protein [Planctomycetota bacterium]
MKYCRIILMALMVVSMVSVAFGRQYDPATGRFTKRDPVEYAAGINLYTYVHNDPVNKTDPTGLFATPTHEAMVDIVCDKTIPTTETTGCKQWITNTLRQKQKDQDSLRGGAVYSERHYTRNVIPTETSYDIATKDYDKYTHDEMTDFYTNLNKPNTAQKCTASMEALGNVTHSWQDFYGHAVERSTGSFEVFSQGRGETPFAFSGWLGPPTWPGQHPLDKEPLFSAGEYNARILAATKFLEEQYNDMITTWLSNCRCHCPPQQD